MTRTAAAIYASTIALLTLVAAPAALAQDVATEFAAAWRTSVSSPPSARATWEAFTQKHGQHDLAQAARLLLGITTLREGAEPKAAMPMFDITEGSGATATRKEIVRGAKGMAARIQMHHLAAALRSYYRTHVEYPATLNDLVAANLATPADITDPFGQPFAYEARARAIMPNVPRQTFTLRCTTIDAPHDGLMAMARDAARPLDGVTVTSLTPAEGEAFVRRTRPDGTTAPAARWTVGQTVEGLTLWGVYESFILVGRQQAPVVIFK